jgi:hypothetical protein
MTRAMLIIAAVALGGCSSNPCDGRGASCVNALVQGYSGALDQLRITIDQPSATSTTTPNPPSSFTLPVKVALVLPSGTTGTVNVGVEGLSSQQVVASTSRAVTLPSSGTVTFTLAASSGGGDDLSMPPSDLAGIVSVAPSSFNFSVNRGGSDTKTFHVGNGTTAPVTATPALNGNGAFTISSDGCAGAMLDVGAGCDVVVKFAPTVSGTGIATMLTVAGAGASITGDAKPAWSVESGPPTSLALHAIVGDAGRYYLTGSIAGMNSQVWTSSGNGTWTVSTFVFSSTDQLTSVAHAGANTYAGGLNGVWSSGPSPWAAQAVPSGDGGAGVSGLYVNPDAGFAVGPAGIFQFNGTAWVMSGPGGGDGGAALINAIASDGNHALFAVGNNAIGYSGDTSGTWTGAIALNAASGAAATTLRGVWMPRGGTLLKAWAVGDTSDVSMAGTIFTVDRATFTGAKDNTTTLPAGTNFYGVHGSYVGGVIRMYAVGAPGTVGNPSPVGTSNGNGTWQPETVPASVALRAVWVSDGVDVFAVGDAGTILHYY